MTRFRKSLVFMVVGLLIVGGGFAYDTARVSLGTFVLLSGLVVVFGVFVVIFLGKMTHPDGTVEQILYKTDHPKSN